MEERNWISKPGAYKVAVKKAMMSESIEGFSGCPFVKFYCETPSGESTGVKFFRTRESDSDKVKEIKQERIAKFIRNAGGSLQASGAKEIFDSVVGNNVYVLLTDKEYVGKDSNNNNKPVVKNVIDYLFSSDKEITKIKPDMLQKKLSPKDQEYFDTQYSMWESANSSSVDEDASGLPF